MQPLTDPLCSSAILRAAKVSSASICSKSAQPITLRENRSKTTAKYTKPVKIRIYGNIRHPNLIALLDLNSLHQIRINPITVITVGGLYPAPLNLTLKRPFPHHPRHTLVIDLPPLAPKLMRHPAIAVACTLHHNLFNAIPKIRFLLLSH